MNTLQLNKLQNVLNDIKAYVVVVGSFARNQANETSDIDLYVKRRPQEELDEDWFGELEEHYMDKVIGAFEKHGLKWDSLFVGYIHTNTLPVQIEASYLFKIHKDTPIKTIELFGVFMESAVDDKNINLEDTFDYFEFDD